ncbi:hypothetical protein L6452_05686 [Arctium lappa]|uniref:Uncharacterized protein n=1 Tax=Arctium lappa TaxID=4217 RepID=A0ACB9EHK0_ARCLA|nr:hypothetical protein L6452_05686 [Arctium lappa]
MKSIICYGRSWNESSKNKNYIAIVEVKGSFEEFMMEAETVVARFLKNQKNFPLALPLLRRFLRDHLLEWTDNNIDAYSAAVMKLGPCSLPGSRIGNFGGQVILPLAHAIVKRQVNSIISDLNLIKS